MNTSAIETMKSIRFGVEIETIGRTQSELASAIATAIEGTAAQVGGYYGKWEVRMADGRAWTLMSDASLSSSRSAEIVSPILTYADLEVLQTVIRTARTAGAHVDASCGVHVHVDASRFDSNGIVRLAKLVYQQEELLIAALGVQTGRLGRYTKRVDEAFIRRLEQERPRDRQALATTWYGGRESANAAARVHYHDSRYHGLNLHSVWFRDTVEFRYFEGTLHAGEIKTYVQLCLALAAKALTSRSALARKRALTPESAKYDVRVFLLRLGLIGEEFKTARHHLLKRLAGSAAWKNGRPASQPPVRPDGTPRTEGTPAGAPGLAH